MTELLNGSVAYFSKDEGEGIVLTQPEGKNYKFSANELRGINNPAVGYAVVIEVDEDGKLRAVFPTATSTESSSREASAEEATSSKPQNTSDEKKGWLAKYGPRVLLVGAVYWAINSDAGNEFISSFMAGFSAGTDIASYDCDTVAKLVKGEELQNVFGGKFKIISTSDLSLVSQTDTKIVCNGKIVLSNAMEQNAELSVWKDGASIMYKVQPQ